MNKVKISVYNSYGNGSGDELYYEYMMFDAPENRKKVLDEIIYVWETDSNVNDFVSGKTNRIAYWRGLMSGGWDEPIGGYIIVETEAEIIGKLELQIAQIKKEFEEIK